MGLSRRLAQSPPSLRWHRSRVVTRVVYKRAFAQVGRGTVIVSPARLRGVERISIGSNCAIFEGSWLACEGGGGPLRIGDNVSLGPGCHIHVLDPITIGDGCAFAEGVYIGSADHDRVDRSAAVSSGPVVIGRGVFVGIRTVILGGVTIGDGATIGAHSVVTRDVAPGATVVGSPARPVPATSKDGT